MKKTVILFVGCVLALSSCASGPKTTGDGRATSGGVPQFVKNAKKGAPTDVLVAANSAKIGAAGLAQAKAIAEVRARGTLSRQINALTESAIRDYTGSSEADSKDVEAYQGVLNTAFSKTNLSGVTIIEEDRDGDNNYWVVISMGKTNVVKEINQAMAAARLAVPKAEADKFETWAKKGLDEAYDRANAEARR